MGEPYHYLEPESYDEYYGVDGSDDGVDACKDANAEMGLDPYNRAGFYEAKRRGWIKKKNG